MLVIPVFLYNVSTMAQPSDHRCHHRGSSTPKAPAQPQLPPHQDEELPSDGPSRCDWWDESSSSSRFRLLSRSFAWLVCPSLSCSERSESMAVGSRIGSRMSGSKQKCGWMTQWDAPASSSRRAPSERGGEGTGRVLNGTVEKTIKLFRF